jgi:hypothetical protein
MRCSLLVLLAGCQTIDIDQPIAVVTDDLPPEFAANLVEAAHCWNLEFGTHFVTDRSAHQAVVGFMDNATCLDADAQTQAGDPDRISICPPRYWSSIDHLYGATITPFRVVSHELGHVLNIVGHPPAIDFTAVMLRGGNVFGPMFTRVDHQVFQAANPEFVVAPACALVIRTFTAGGQIGHCTCEGETIDLSQPIALVSNPPLDPQRLAKAASCWNAAYGLSLEVTPPAPGEQVAHLDHCLEHVVGRSIEAGQIEACITAAYDELHAIGIALGDQLPLPTSCQ